MEIVFSSFTYYNNFRDTFFSSMVNKKLELTFTHGLLFGIVIAMIFSSVIMDKFFVSKEAFNLQRIYVDGKIYRLCRDR